MNVLNRRRLRLILIVGILVSTSARGQFGERRPITQQSESGIAFRDCQLIDQQGQPPAAPGLSALWNLEMTGADLAKKFMAEWSKSHPLYDAKIAVVDTVFEDNAATRPLLAPNGQRLVVGESQNRDPHGFNVLRRLADPLFGTYYFGRVSFLVQMLGYANLLALQFLEAFAPDVVSTSAGAYYEEARHVMNALVAKGTVFVTAAGNDYPGYNPGFQAALAVPSIMISALAYNGLLSEYSSERPDISVSGPSSASSFIFENIRPGGTSAATPHVSGVVGNVKAFLPQITQDEVRELLEQTALKTLFQRIDPTDNLQNGVGLVNAYKAVRVAARLAENQLQPYDFRVEARRKLADALVGLESPKCETRKAAFDSLRAAFFLDPSETSRRKIEEIYQAHGFTKNAEFYESLTDDRESQLDFLRRRLQDTPEPDNESRMAKHFQGDLAYNFLSRLSSANAVTREVISEIENEFRVKKAEPQQLKAAFDKAHALGVYGLPLIEKYLNDPVPQIQSYALAIVIVDMAGLGPTRYRMAMEQMLRQHYNLARWVSNAQIDEILAKQIRANYLRMCNKAVDMACENPN